MPGRGRRKSAAGDNPNYTRGHSINEGSRGSQFGVSETLGQGNPAEMRRRHDARESGREVGLPGGDTTARPAGADHLGVSERVEGSRLDQNVRRPPPRYQPGRNPGFDRLVAARASSSGRRAV